MKPEDIIEQDELVLGHCKVVEPYTTRPAHITDPNCVGGITASGQPWHDPPPMTREEAEQALKQVSKNLKDMSVPQAARAMRFDADKLRLDLIPPEFLIELARVYSMGAMKYDDDNWRKGMPWRKCVRPVWSHLIKWLSGQTIDSETGCHHLAMVAWNCATLFMYQLHKLGTDDRYKFGIDENFKWVDNHLNIGLDDAKMTELKDKYKQQRENRK